MRARPALRPNLRKSTLRLALLAGLSVASADAFAQAGPDAEFVLEAYSANLFCIMSSHMALEKSRDPDIREFAKRMISRHGWAKTRLEEIVASAKLDVTLKPGHLRMQHLQTLKELHHTAPGVAFDQNYMNAQKDGHAEALVRFHNYAQYGATEELKRFSGGVLGSLSRHHDKSEELLAEAAQAALAVPR